MPGIDIHTHAFHPKIAHKVLAMLEGHYSIPPRGTGLIEDLLARQRSAGVSRCVLLCAATAGAQVLPANNFAIQMQREHPEVVSFGTLHPDYADWEQELERLRAAGIRGLKLHPEFQGFWLDDPRLLPIIEAAQKHFCFLFHVGDSLSPKQNPSCPYKMAAILRQFPQARMIAAHMGGYLHWEHSLEVLAGSNVYFDTSSTLSFVADDVLRELMRRHPRERILFGSDYPLFDPGDEIARLHSRLGFSDAEIEEVLCNGDAFLDLCPPCPEAAG